MMISCAITCEKKSEHIPKLNECSATKRNSSTSMRHKNFKNPILE